MCLYLTLRTNILQVKILILNFSQFPTSFEYYVRLTFPQFESHMLQLFPHPASTVSFPGDLVVVVGELPPAVLPVALFPGVSDVSVPFELLGSSLLLPAGSSSGPPFPESFETTKNMTRVIIIMHKIVRRHTRIMTHLGRFVPAGVLSPSFLGNSSLGGISRDSGSEKKMNTIFRNL